jgi:pyrimidine oxygenase
MDLGVFLPSATQGFIISTTTPTITPTYELNRDVTKLCEDIGFEFALSMVKHRGWGGESRFWDEALDSFTLMAALAVETERITVIPSVPVLAVHPVTAARQAVTVNEIAEGRFALNIVTGWSRAEYTQLGLWPGEEHYRKRYDHATEYVQIMKDFWSTGRSSFHGEYFEMNDAQCFPTPPGGDIPLVCAGRSGRGIRFTAEVGKYNFVLGDPLQLAQMKQELADASAATGRDVGTLALFVVFMAPTDKEAEELYRHTVDGADREAIERMRYDMSLDSGGGTAASALEVEKSMFMGQTPLIGSYETVSKQLLHLQENEIVAGCMFSFRDYLGDLESFGEHVMPRLNAGALR